MSRLCNLGIRGKLPLLAMLLVGASLALGGCSSQGEGALSEFFRLARCSSEGGSTYCYGDHGHESGGQGGGGY